MAIRIKTKWFKGGERNAEETATAIAMTLWRLSDGAIDNLSKADYDIITPQRGFRVIAELACFLAHYVDRLIYERIDDEERTALITALAKRLAEIMEENILDFTGGQKDPEYDYQAGFIDLLNQRNADYAEFEFPADRASFQALRFLSLQIREVMEDSDKTWIQDQIMDIEMPDMMGTVKKQIDGFFADES